MSELEEPNISAFFQRMKKLKKYGVENSFVVVFLLFVYEFRRRV